MPTKEDKARIKELKELSGKRLVDPMEIIKSAGRCLKVAKEKAETADDNGPPIKEEFWKCMRSELEGEKPKKEKYVR